ncbi:zinc finger protein 660-like [Plectropomus leopardus]|uniref:zinc finger protein 660-like n=1 Tax=Plectropomus leopardus TaxID=160734 RepID=UPI001C4B925A|nr:zinc finger protein 660-like [Plectropomus leopardus]
MSSIKDLTKFVNERLTAAAEEILLVFQRSIAEYEKEIVRQQRLLDVASKPETKLQRTENCNQERKSSVDQEDPEPPQIKEEQEELCVSQEGEQLDLKEEADTFMLTPTCDEDRSEDQTLLVDPDKNRSAAEKESVDKMPVISCVVSEAHSHQQLLSHNFHVAESQNQRGGEHGGSGSTRDAEPKLKIRSHSNNIGSSNLSQIPCKTQTGKKSFKCDTCGKDFAFKSHLVRHLRVHTGEKPYSCEICGRRFSRCSVLNVHMSVHTGEKPYPCKTCGKMFCSQSLLSHRKRTQLPASVSSIWRGNEICSEKSDVSEPNVDHKLLSHNAHGTESEDQKRSSHGKARLAKNDPYTKKTESTECSCSECHSATKIYSDDDEKPFKCDTCDQAFEHNESLKSHVKTHTGKLPYGCKYCERHFRLKGSRDRHKKSHEAMGRFTQATFTTESSAERSSPSTPV